MSDKILVMYESTVAAMFDRSEANETSGRRAATGLAAHEADAAAGDASKGKGRK